MLNLKMENEPREVKKRKKKKKRKEEKDIGDKIFHLFFERKYSDLNFDSRVLTECILCV